ncbi:MAG TPA: tripartite tricarboxylate transporter substrate binding protein [Xanthobacteraceae bacterium]|nr:tripartite tricarboxylate transporter substrate binding protein [Xanthobacteraceae bacterium]
MGKSRKLLKRAAVLAALTALCAVSASPTQAQDYPTRPIRVLIAFPPGGPTDFVGRLIADKMSTLLGQRVYIENKPGANGTVGADNIAKADPDGYSLFLTTAGAVTISPHIIANIPYDSLRDFAPIAEVVTNTTVLVVSPKMAIKTAKELVALAEQKPGAISFASTGIGSTTHLAQVLLADAAGASFLHVPYRGAAPMLTDLLGDQVQVVAADLTVLMSQIEAGTVVPIGAAADRRNQNIPDVPTLAEQGYPNTDASNWYALLAPAKTPTALIKKLNDAVNVALDDPDIRGKIVKSGAVPVGGTPEALGKFMRAEYDKWGRVVRDHGIKETP